MGKFKVGDKVKPTEGKRAEILLHWNTYWSREYGTATEFYVVRANETLINISAKRDGNGPAWFPSNFELVSPVWVPKVGDRVVVLDNVTPYGEPIKKYEVGKEYEVTYMCKDSKGGDAVMLLGHNQYLRPDQYAKPPTLTIEPGKFYKTRDGRKVGPMEKGGQWPKGPWFFKFGDNHFEKSGKSCFGGNGMANRPTDDLIAEWQEPAVVSTAGAQVDALAEEYGPTLHVDPSAMIAKALGANDNKSGDLAITISTDAAQTNEALDEIIRKLKKIRRLSAELGIDLAA